jgi:hypothetical protein
LDWLIASAIGWFISGAVALVLASFGVYRAVARLSGRGPNDT